MAQLISSKLNLFTFPPEKPAIDLLAAHLLAEAGGDSLSLSRMLVLLPSRRGVTALRDALLRCTDGRPTLLPAMQSLTQPEEGADVGGWLAQLMGEPDIAPPIAPLKRHMQLTRLVAKHRKEQSPQDATDMEQAALLARELMRFLDDAYGNECDLEQLPSLVQESELAEHWNVTHGFLMPLLREWHGELEKEQLSEQVRYQQHQLQRLVNRWEKEPPAQHIIAVAAPGMSPAVCRLLSVIATLPQGKVMLWGLDTALPDACWRMLDETHPQFAHAQLLKRLEVQRSDIRLLDEASIPFTANKARTELLRQALLPASATAQWLSASPSLLDGAVNMHRVNSANEQDEARLIALLLRETLETPGKTAAVITEDRALARRIRAEAERFHLLLDDSAGTPLKHAAGYVFLQLAVNVAESEFAPVPLLALLKHPFASAGLGSGECRRIGRLLERVGLRGIRREGGIAEYRASVLHDQARREGRTILSAQEAQDVLRLLDALERCFAPLMQALSNKRTALADILSAHLETTEALAEGAQEPLWGKEEGRQLAACLQALRSHAQPLSFIDTHYYGGVLDALIGHTPVRKAYAHPRLHILSAREARLQRFDRVILAGLNEGSWPPEAPASPWMSRPMQRAFGLPTPEVALGISAHDFVQAALAGEVFLTRSEKAGGSPARPNRWLRRLDAVLAAATQGAFRWSALPQQAWAQQLNAAKPIAPLAPPAPAPGLSQRPAQLSVTDIELLQRDPYQIYARRVLKLKPLDAVEEEPSVRHVGILTHLALERFVREFPRGTLPEDAPQRFHAIADETFEQSEWAHRPAVRAYWLPRLKAVGDWIIEQERLRRTPNASAYAELEGAWKHAGLELTTRIDRIDIDEVGAARLLDYKTGSPPTLDKVLTGVPIQLPLEALVLLRGEVKDRAGRALTAPSRIEALEYWKIAGEARSETSELSRKAKFSKDGEQTQAEVNATALMALALARLELLIEAYGKADMPYLVLPDANYAPAYIDAGIEHLERREEWEA